MTLTFVESHYPRDLLEHFEKVRNFTVEEKYPGIYNISGDILSIQIIDNRKLSPDENVWLKNLDTRLGKPDILKIETEANKKGKNARIGAYLNVVLSANIKVLREVIKMSDVALTLEQVLEEAGYYARAEARAEARKEAKTKAEIALNMLNDGFSIEKIARLTGLEVEKVKELAEKENK